MLRLVRGLIFVILLTGCVHHESFVDRGKIKVPVDAVTAGFIAMDEARSRGWKDDFKIIARLPGTPERGEMWQVFLKTIPVSSRKKKDSVVYISNDGRVILFRPSKVEELPQEFQPVR